MNEPIFLSETTSTNDYLFSIGEKEPFFAVVAERQTRGKGSKGRTFLSPVGGLYLSVVAPKDEALFPILTPLAAVAVKRAVWDSFGIDLGIKWVNDLMIDRGNGYKKVCGILTETRTAEKVVTVIGIGVNVFRAQEGYEGLETIVGYLSEEKPDKMILQSLAKKIVEELKKVFSAPDEGMQEYARSSILEGKTVRYQNPRTKGDYFVRGIDERGRLILETDGETIVVDDGEVTAWQKS